MAPSADINPATPDQTDLKNPTPDKYGWASISRFIRQADAERIGSCNDEIDALLTFAGLYSAVLTAFLVESYKSLSQDPQDTMVFLLQQLVAQTNSFVINDRFINSTFSHPVFVPTFVLSSNIKNVNALWFASLVLSLTCASFSIIVKQWLREFMHLERSSSLKYLRVRHFRNPGIARYKVVEIVALLPFLIQLSLLLFFIGLCLFTASIHQTIGHVTFGLVAAWAFFLLATAFFPVYDSVCPYKTPALGIFLNIVKSLLNLLQPQSELNSTEYNESNPNARDDPIPNESNPDVRDDPIPNESNPRDDPIPDKSNPDTRDDPIRNEADAARSNKHDIAILTDALTRDAVAVSDELLGDVIVDAISRRRLPPDEIFEIPLAVVDARSLSSGTMQRSRNEFLDRVEALPSQSYTTVAYMLTLLVENAMRAMVRKPDQLFEDCLNQRLHYGVSSDDSGVRWLEYSICALLCPCRPSPATISALYTCLARPVWCRHFFWLIRTNFPSNNLIFRSVLTMFQSELAKEHDMSKLLHIVFSMIWSRDARAPPFDITAADLRFEDKETQELMSGCKSIFKALFQPFIGASDIKTLACIDAILLDDQFLKGHIWSSLQLRISAPEPIHLSKLIREAISNRTHCATPQGRILNLERLDQAAYASVMELAADFVIQELPAGEPVTVTASAVFNNALESVVCILLSPWGKDSIKHTSEVDQAFQRFLSDGYHVQTARLIRSSCSLRKQGLSENFLVPQLSKVLQNLRSGFVLGDNAVSLISFIQHIFPSVPVWTATNRNGREWRHRRVIQSLEFDSEGRIAYNIPVDCTEAVLDLFLSNLRVSAESQQQDGHRSLLFEIVFQLSDRLPELQKNWIAIFVVDVLSSAATHFKDAEIICDIAFNIAFHSSFVVKGAQKALAMAAGEIHSSERLSQILTALQKYQERRRLDTGPRQSESIVLPTIRSTAETAYADVNVLPTLRFYLQLLHNPRRNLHHADHVKQYRELFDLVLPSLRSLSGTGVNMTTVASECIDLIPRITEAFRIQGLDLPFRPKELIHALEAIC